MPCARNKGGRAHRGGRAGANVKTEGRKSVLFAVLTGRGRAPQPTQAQRVLSGPLWASEGL